MEGFLGTFENVNFNNFTLFLLIVGTISILASIFAFLKAKQKNSVKLEKDGRWMLMLGLAMIASSLLYLFV